MEDANSKVRIFLKLPSYGGAIALSYPLLLLMTHHDETWLNALP